jgi:hypothetical protein
MRDCQDAGIQLTRRSKVDTTDPDLHSPVPQFTEAVAKNLRHRIEARVNVNVN